MRVPHTHVAVHLILTSLEGVFLMRRFQTGFADGDYGLISGHLEQGESCTHGIIREAFEEAGIHIDEKDLRLVYTFNNRNSVQGREYIGIFFECNNWTGELRNAEPEACDDVRFFPRDRLPGNMVPHIRRILEESAQGICYGEDGWEK